MFEEKLSSISSFIRENTEVDSNEVSEAFEYLKLKFNDIYKNIASITKNKIYSKNATEIRDLIDKLEIINAITNEINDMKNMFYVEVECFEEDEEYEENTNILPDYDKYKVNSEKPHSLLEDYTHKKVCGYLLKGERRNANTMKEFLTTLCSIPYKKIQRDLKNL